MCYRRLIRDHGFSFVAVEGDWPDVYRINRFVVCGTAGITFWRKYIKILIWEWRFRYVHSDPRSTDNTAEEALGDFQRFPQWMWRYKCIVWSLLLLHGHVTIYHFSVQHRNHAVRDFVEWLREYNGEQHETKKKAGFYGLDLYSMYTSAQKVIEYLQQVDPSTAKIAKKRYYQFFNFIISLNACAILLPAHFVPLTWKQVQHTESI